MVDLEQTSFRYLLRHSFRFFSDNFAGSLVRKVHRLSRAFEEVLDIAKESFLALIMTITGIVLVIYQRSPVIAGIVFAWTVLFMAINYSFSRWNFVNG